MPGSGQRLLSPAGWTIKNRPASRDPILAYWITGARKETSANTEVATRTCRVGQAPSTRWFSGVKAINLPGCIRLASASLRTRTCVTGVDARSIARPSWTAAGLCTQRLHDHKTCLRNPAGSCRCYRSSHWSSYSRYTQVKFTQVCPEGQTCPQAPQLLRSVCKFVSQPLARFPSQLPKPALQEIWQVLLTQLAVPLVELQTFAHDPQWFGSVTVFVSQPLDAMPSQSAKP